MRRRFVGLERLPFEKYQADTYLTVRIVLRIYLYLPSAMSSRQDHIGSDERSSALNILVGILQRNIVRETVRGCRGSPDDEVSGSQARRVGRSSSSQKEQSKPAASHKLAPLLLLYRHPLDDCVYITIVSNQRKRFFSQLLEGVKICFLFEFEKQGDRTFF